MTVGYTTTFEHWGFNLDDVRRYLQIEPGEYAFHVHACEECGSSFVVNNFKGLTDYVESHSSFFDRQPPDYLAGAQPPVDRPFCDGLLAASQDRLNPFQSRFRWVRSMVSAFVSGRKNPVRILDIGAAFGSIGRFLELTVPGVDVWCCETNPVSRMVLKRRYPGMKLVESVMENFSPALQFDFVYCADVIEHVWDIDGFLRSLNGILAEQGRALVVTPDAGCADARARGAAWWGFIVPHHAQILTVRGLSEAAEAQRTFHRVTGCQRRRNMGTGRPIADRRGLMQHAGRPQSAVFGNATITTTSSATKRRCISSANISARTHYIGLTQRRIISTEKSTSSTWRKSGAAIETGFHAVGALHAGAPTGPDLGAMGDLNYFLQLGPGGPF